MNLKYCYVGEEFQQVNWSVPPPPSLGVSVQPTSAVNIDEEKQRREGTNIKRAFCFNCQMVFNVHMASKKYAHIFFYFLASFFFKQRHHFYITRQTMTDYTQVLHLN